MLNAVIHAPERRAEEPEPADATKVVPLPEQPGEQGTRGKRGEEAGEKLRGALRSVRKAAVAAGSAGAAAAARAKSAAGNAPSASHAATRTRGTAARTPGAPAGTPATAPPAPASPPASAPVTNPAAAPGAAAPGTARQQPPSGGRSSGWPVMTPPDLPPRPVPRASLTDVVPRRTLVLIAVVVALALLGIVLAVALSGGDDEGGTGAKAGGDRTAAGEAPSADTKSDENDGTRTDGEATGPADKDTAPGARENTAGAGGGPGKGKSSGNGGGTSAEQTYRGSQGYSIGLPKGWKYRSSGPAGDRFTGPDGQKLLIGWTTTPKDDPVADWKNQERSMVRSQYRRIRIEAVEYRGWNTADWEFTYVEGGTKYRSVDRGTVVGDHLGYGLMYTAKAAEWGSEQRKDTWRTLTGTFRPKS